MNTEETNSLITAEVGCVSPAHAVAFSGSRGCERSPARKLTHPRGRASASEKGAVVDAAVAWVERAIAADRKIGALKTLQVSSCSVCSDRPSMFMSFLLICNVGICP